MNAADTKKKDLEVDISILLNNLEKIKKHEEQGLDKIKNIDREIQQRKQELQDLHNAFEKYQQDTDTFMADNKQLMLQYYIVEKFVAMLRTSPSEKKVFKNLPVL